MAFVETYVRNDVGDWVADLEQTIKDSGASGAATVQYVVYETPDQVRVYTDQQMSAGEIAAVGTEVTNWVVPSDLSTEEKIAASSINVVNMSLRDPGSSFKEINSTNWAEVTSFIYNGTKSVNPIRMISANLWNSSNGQTSDLRVICLTTGAIIGSLSATTNDPNNIESTTIISNLPTTRAKLSIQIKDQGGKARCSNVTIFI